MNPRTASGGAESGQTGDQAGVEASGQMGHSPDWTVDRSDLATDEVPVNPEASVTSADFDRWGNLLSLLVQGLTRQTIGELRQALEQATEQVQLSLTDEVAGVREDLVKPQRDLARLGRELVRTNATLEAVQGTVAAFTPALEHLAAAQRSQQAREEARERQSREAVTRVEREMLEDLLAAIDGLELGLDAGRDVVETLRHVAHHQTARDEWAPEMPAPTPTHGPWWRRWWQRRSESTVPTAGNRQLLAGSVADRLSQPGLAQGSPAATARAVEADGAGVPVTEVPRAEVEALVEGLQLTYRRLQDALARRGVMPIAAVGQPFDPHLHEAVAVEPCPPEQDGMVLREERRGYRTAEHVLRLAQVVVGCGTVDEA
jgi:molecular chaperone GrpE (heat shock protein)